MNRSSRIRVLALATCSAIVAPHAFPASSASLALGPETSTSISWPKALHRALQRVADVEWRLQEAAGSSCPANQAGTGLILDSLDAYAIRDRTMVQAEVGLTDLPMVAAVAAGSPADLAGIVPGDEIVSVNGGAMSGPAETLRNAETPVAPNSALHAMAWLSRLPTGTPTPLLLRRSGTELTVEITPLVHCGSRVFVSTANQLAAYSDGTNVVITARLVDFTRSADELALLAGHELAHAIARDTKAASLRQRRTMETRADLLGADLASCAGYDPKAGAPFWQRWSTSSVLDFLPSPTHGSGRKRTEAILHRPPPTTCPVAGAPAL